MNAQTKAVPAWQRYVPIVKHHLPHAKDEELRARCGLLLLRDQAQSKLRSCSEEAAGPLNEIVRDICFHAFRSMRLEDLKDLHYGVVQLARAASTLERFAYNVANPENRQAANGRG